MRVFYKLVLDAEEDESALEESSVWMHIKDTSFNCESQENISCFTVQIFPHW